MTFRDRRGGLYLRKLAHPMGFRNGIAKAKQPKPDGLEGPNSLVPSTTWSQNRRKLYHCFMKQKREGALKEEQNLV